MIKALSHLSTTDIAEIEALLGRDFSAGEQKAILLERESCEVSACPGSGKTTLLVAKIAMLLRHTRSKTNGMCVLSHTNVAKDEVELALAKRGLRRLSFPHYIGTIQAFIDRFLAIPAAHLKFNADAQFDDVLYERALKREYFRERKYTALKKAIWATKEYHPRVKEYDTYEFLKNIAFTGSSLSTVFSRSNILGLSKADTLRDALELKNALASEGLFQYQDAYDLALWYLNTNQRIGPLLRKRFSLVFIDEMQDCDSLQAQVLRAVFQGNVVQAFGDTNQAIFGTLAPDMVVAPWEGLKQLPLRTSFRVSPSIAQLSLFAANNKASMEGNPKNPNCQHTIIFFDSDRINDVLKTYVDVIIANNLTDLENGSFTAVGARRSQTRSPKQYNIQSYLRDSTSTSLDLKGGLISVFAACKGALLQNDSLAAKQALLAMLSELLNMEGLKADDKRFTPSRLVHHFDENARADDLRKFVVRTLSSFRRNEVIRISDFQSQIILLFGDDVGEGFKSAEARNYFSGTQDIEWQKTPATKAVEASVIQSGDKTITISIDTIHGVKGQTHTATLLLDTFILKTHHFNKIIDYILKPSTSAKDARDAYRLSLAYVAMTRPTHLLCIAARLENGTKGTKPTAKQIEKLQAIGWNVIVLVSTTLP